PPVSEISNTILVVEGMIAVGDSAENKFLLSRLKPLDDTTLNDPETRAQVLVESSAGGSWVLPETNPGTYSAVNNIPTNANYRLRITASNGKSYETPFMKPVNTPPIDSVTWLQPDNLTIYVHSFDPSGTTRYYRWDYAETWEYRSYYNPEVEYVNGSIVLIPPSRQIYSCWRFRNSNTINIHNTTALSEDRVSYFPLKTITNGAEEGSARYSILVRQMGLTKEAYEFWSILKKNTELTGSLFDPQPSQLPSNITCVSDPAERVVGYVCAGKQELRRMFVTYSELTTDDTKWPVFKDDDLCRADSTGGTARMDQDPNYVPAFFYGSPGVLAIAKKICVDCREQGGTNSKPLYW
ncbi:MAG TPA: DUF4249 domain-containing protein, partial [Chitinophagaceae bacterium]|nr:DUF4249 domain-containing protein [Chitinophagaceae bacterium]